MKQNLAFSGLEAAIIMIAFVVVAAVFSYSVLSMGFFATGKVQEVTYAGIKEVTSSTFSDGFVGGMYDETKGGLTRLIFSINVPESGQSIDLSKMTYYYATDNNVGSDISLNAVTPHDGFVESGGSQRISIDLEAAGMTGPLAGGTFSLEIKPPTGASTLIHRMLSNTYTGGYLP